MSDKPSHRVSFSQRQRVGIFFSVLISIAMALALVVMLNYLGATYFKRFLLSSQTIPPLSPQSLSLVKSITNDVKVIIYYDKSDGLYDMVKSLLDEYHLANPKIVVSTVDYESENSAAAQVKATYKLGAGQSKDLIIFDCENRTKIIPGSAVGQFGYEEAMSDEKDSTGQTRPTFDKKLKAFDGERWFSAALLNVINSKPRIAYYLKDHGEHDLNDDNPESLEGYGKFKNVLGANNIFPAFLSLAGTNTVPADCRLLIIAGARKRIPDDELDKIQQYLNQGGRLFVLFNTFAHYDTGLEDVLTNWDVVVRHEPIGDPESEQSGGALVVNNFSRMHPVTEHLAGSALAMVHPYAVGYSQPAKSNPEAPKVTDIAQTGPNAVLVKGNIKIGHAVPLIVAVEKGGIKGVFPERGTTEMVVVGDSLFLGNRLIDAADNRDFAEFAVNWLVDQTSLLQGIGPHPVKEYKLLMTNAQMHSIQWIFLAAMPGGILALGGLVWFRRRR